MRNPTGYYPVTKLTIFKKCKTKFLMQKNMLFFEDAEPNHQSNYLTNNPADTKKQINNKETHRY
jgi:hypothetical protein